MKLTPWLLALILLNFASGFSPKVCFAGGPTLPASASTSETRTTENDRTRTRKEIAQAAVDAALKESNVWDRVTALSQLLYDDEFYTRTLAYSALEALVRSLIALECEPGSAVGSMCVELKRQLFGALHENLRLAEYTGDAEAREKLTALVALLPTIDFIAVAAWLSSTGAIATALVRDLANAGRALDSELAGRTGLRADLNTELSALRDGHAQMTPEKKQAIKNRLLALLRPALDSSCLIPDENGAGLIPDSYGRAYLILFVKDEASGRSFILEVASPAKESREQAVVISLKAESDEWLPIDGALTEAQIRFFGIPPGADRLAVFRASMLLEKINDAYRMYFHTSGNWLIIAVLERLTELYPELRSNVEAALQSLESRGYTRSGDPALSFSSGEPVPAP